MQFTKPLGRERDVLSCRPLRLFPKRVQDNDPVRQRRQIDHAEGACAITNAKLTDAGADCLYRLPIVRLQATLNPIELIAGGATRGRRKVSQPCQRVACEFDRLRRAAAYIKTDLIAT